MSNLRVNVYTIKDAVLRLRNDEVDNEIMKIRNLGLNDFPDFTEQVDRALELFEPLLRKEADVFGIGMVFLGDDEEYIWEVNAAHQDVVMCTECGTRETLRISVKAETLAEALCRVYLIYMRFKDEFRL